MSQRLFIVDDTFQIRGRGVVLSPGLNPDIKVNLHIGDPILLKRPDGTAFTWTISGIGFQTPNPSHTLPLLLKDLRKEEIPIGTEVWTDDNSTELHGTV